MGGIAGIIHHRGSRPNRDQASQLSAGVAHRGPHDKGLWGEGPIVLVHRRLQSGRNEPREPVVSQKTALVVDGRLPAGVDVLLNAWDENGSDCLQALRGAFAFAAWDRRNQVLWLARDPCGTRPLFWTKSGSKVAFASEIAPLLHLPWVSRDMAVDSLSEYLSFRYVHAPRTMLENIHAVPPGHTVRIDADGIRMDQWWSPRWSKPDADANPDKDNAERVDTALRRAVERRLIGEADIGLLLSGGLDSSALLYHAKSLGADVTAFSVGLADDPSDEIGFAARVSKVLDVPHQIIRVEAEQIAEAVDDCTRMMGQPLPSSAALVEHLCLKAVRPSLRVMLSGAGGDELLGGRGMQHLAARLRRARAVGRLPGPTNHIWKRVARKAGLTDLAVSAAHFGQDRNIGGSRVFHSRERVALLRDPAMVRPGIRETVLEPLYQEVSTDPINAVLHVWQRGWLPEDTLARIDRMASHLGMEIRYPFVDRDLLQVCASFPGPAKVPPKGIGFATKWPLRMAMSERLPNQLINRPKRSMPSPLGRWLRTSGSEFLKAQVEELVAEDSAYFLTSEVRRLMDSHLNGSRNNGLKLWTLILFHRWRRQMCP